MSSGAAGVDDLRICRAGCKQAEPAERDAVLAALRAIAESDRRAYVALAWLLMPGASLVAGRLRRLADAIDEVVAGQLWIQICEHDPADDTYVAKKILRRVTGSRWPSSASASWPSVAIRRGRRRSLVERFDESIPAEEPDD